MTGGARIFLVTLLLSGGAWAVLARPALQSAGEARDRPREVAGETVPDAAAEALAEDLHEALRGTGAAPPEGIRRAGDGEYAGSIPWSRVADFMEWVDGQGRPVQSVEVLPSPEDPAQARCRLVTEQP